jgi:methionyl-tRNA formyltransferase
MSDREPFLSNWAITAADGSSPPTAVLICHENDRLDREGLASWLASSTNLIGLLVIRDRAARLWRAARREIRRVGWLRFADVVAFRAYSRVRLASRDIAWKDRELARLRQRYPAALERIPRLIVASPNSEASHAFLARLRPDLIIARSKRILKPSIFRLARAGAFALHPGICPEYRNAHGCFWALVNRDLSHVGMSLIKIDEGVDTGPVYLHATCPFDEVNESHSIIQYRVVYENLDAIAHMLLSFCRGEATPLATAGRRSAAWGQPRLSAYLRWKSTARQVRNDPPRLTALP